LIDASSVNIELWKHQEIILPSLYYLTLLLLFLLLSLLLLLLLTFMLLLLLLLISDGWSYSSGISC
jgi:hypothetical protein